MLIHRDKTTNFNFVGQSPLFVSLSTILVIVSLILVFTKGLNYGIDFAGGTELQLKFNKPVAVADIRAALATVKLEEARVQTFGKAEENEFLLRLNRSSSDPSRFDKEIRAAIQAKLAPAQTITSLRYSADRLYVTFSAAVDPAQLKQWLAPINAEELTIHDVALFGKEESNEYVVNYAGVGKIIVQAFGEKFGADSFEVRREDTVGPKVGAELRTKSVSAIVVALVLLLIYIWLRFDAVFAPGAILSLFHDVTITLGIFALLGYQVDLTVLAALLTLVGYSLNDTIVIYDRIRENQHRMDGAELREIINVSVNQTLSRTIMTSGATMLVTLSLQLFGGEIIHNFAVALTIGIIAGSYSTIYIASPMSLFIHRLWIAKKA